MIPVRQAGSVNLKLETLQPFRKLRNDLPKLFPGNVVLPIVKVVNDASTSAS
jgi:hypothetical protein